jgi:hypothetical protein
LLPNCDSPGGRFGYGRLLSRLGIADTDSHGNPNSIDTTHANTYSNADSNSDSNADANANADSEYHTACASD